MKTTAAFRSIAFALGLGLAAGNALAEEPAAAADPAVPAPAAAQPAPPAAPDAPEAGKTRVFSMSIDTESKDDADGSHGVRITVEGDEERGEVAGKVIGRVVDDLEAALADLPEEVRKDVDAGDIEELRGAVRELRELRGLREERVVVHKEGDGAVLENLAPVLSILLIFGGPVLIVAIVSYNNRRKRQMVHETIDRVIAQGKDVPVELLDALDKPRNGKTALARGSVNIAIGVALGAMLFALAGPDVATIGLIPLCIGLAQLLVWKLENRPPA